MSKTFTLEEAQTVLPVLGSLLRRARESAARAGSLQGEMQALSQRIFLAGGMHVDIPAAARRRAEREKAVQGARKTIDEIEEIGAQIGDLEEGLVELPCAVEGRVVLLCWTLGEAEIQHWREAEEGAPMRRLSEGPFGRERDRLH